MPIHLYRRPSFERSLKHLGYEQRGIVGAILEALIAPGFFYKQLRKPYCEAGIETNIRVVIRREEGKGIAVLAGNHDQVRKILANL